MIKALSGLVSGGKSHFLIEKLKSFGNIAVIAKDEDIPAWKDNLNALIPYFSPYNLDNVKVLTFTENQSFSRIQALSEISNHGKYILLATKESLGLRILSEEGFKSSKLKFTIDSVYGFDDLFEKLEKMGYQRSDFVEDKGYYSRRGEILDIWPVDSENPWRIVFYRDVLESMGEFDVVTQRTSGFFNSGELIPAVDFGDKTILDLMPKQALYFADYSDDELIKTYLYDKNVIVNDPMEGIGEEADYSHFTGWSGNFGLFTDELSKKYREGYKNIVFCANDGEKERIEDLLAEHKWHAAPPELFIGPLKDGFFSPCKKLAVYSSQEILYKRKILTFPKFKTGRRLEGLWEISAGDYVVHEKYGIGKYLGLKKIAKQDSESEYLCILYKGGDKLYVPLEDFKIVQKYVGIEGSRPKLYSLDTGLWERVKKRAKKGAEDIAKELLALYVQRKNSAGTSYPLDNPWEKELSDSFNYTETQDQKKTIEDINQDLYSASPMERLVCGDVGFGKTEVAIRAAFKVALNSKQAAVLVPTTVLAEQHYNTFTSRLSAFPVKIAFLSRFQTSRETKRILNQLKEGLIDIIIGTHKILQKKIEFKDLGLLIIDEEHRFGVKQKERIKNLKKDVDILLLSATPIPRTLSMALSNLRDLSVIETPPYGRLPIETHLGQYDEKTVVKIIKAELSRGGQVFYVHNRVQTIISRLEYLKRLMPGIKWAIVHGQMPSGQIEKAMWEFLHRKIDVLIATTIIESGLDIPTVNTMIIEEAENFGLAQLYQLRGRIGREKQKAYCYLFYTKSSLTPDAKKRLQSLQELTELGSGFRLALRDLEIRGGGNILGASQHGFVREIGFQLYSRLIEEASRKLKGQAISKVNQNENPRTVIELNLLSYIPETYVNAEDIRIIFYRKLLEAKSKNDTNDILDELKDRFGRIPKEVKNLGDISSLRILAAKSGIKSIIESEYFYGIYFEETLHFSPETILKLAQEFKDDIEFIRGESYGIKLKNKESSSGKVFYIEKFIEKLKKYTG